MKSTLVLIAMTLAFSSNSFAMCSNNLESLTSVFTAQEEKGFDCTASRTELGEMTLNGETLGQFSCVKIDFDSGLISSVTIEAKLDVLHIPGLLGPCLSSDEVTVEAPQVIAVM